MLLYMKNKNFVSISILLIFGTTFVGLLALSPSNQMVWASIAGSNNSSNSNQQEGSDSCNPEDCPPPHEAIDHINKAQSAIKNGDTEGAQKHLDLAKQSLGCSPIDPRC